VPLNWSGFIYIIPYILSSIICVGVSLFAFKRREQIGAWPLIFITVFETIWCIGYLLQLLIPGLAGKLFWNNVQFLGAVGGPIAYLSFGLAYTQKKIKPATQNVIIGLAAALLLLIWTDGLHHLFRIDPHLVPGTPYSALVFIDGPLFNLFPFFTYLLMIVGTYILINHYISAPRTFRLQVGTVLVGVIIPWVVTLIAWTKIIPIPLHKAVPIAFAVSNLVLVWGLFRYHLLDLVPIAYASLVESIEDGIIVLDKNLLIVDMNPAALHTFNVELDQALGKLFQQVLPVFQPFISKSAEWNTAEKELDLVIGGETRILEIRSSTILDNRHENTGLLILLRDITSRKKIDSKLQLLAITDHLTGLFNRRYFFELAERELERSKRESKVLSIIIFDIDHFKNVNDSYGHLVGDQVLQCLTRRCQGSLRVYDVMARYGGEEFIILLPETDPKQACLVAERLRSAIAETPFTTAAGQAEVTISLGVSTLPEKTNLTLDQLVDEADHALMMGKQRGRNQVQMWGKPALDFGQDET
jgi:diguanylate cyclase (GGDEF)-like protein/PAS domain S-box-containing protein